MPLSFLPKIRKIGNMARAGSYRGRYRLYLFIRNTNLVSRDLSIMGLSWREPGDGDRRVSQPGPAGGVVAKRMLKPVRIVALGKVGPVVGTAGLLAGERPGHHSLGQLHQRSQLQRGDKIGVEELAAVI